MASTPTTKSQVQAYRFVLKRMESALVRRDAVMLHDPMRTHIRAGIVGLCLALVAVAGVFIYGFFKPKEALGTSDGIVMGSDSGSVFVLLNNPSQRLVPALNLASARLILVKQAGNGGVGNAATATPRRVKDDVLKDVPREPIAGIPGAPADIPGANELVDPKWTLCDTTTQDESLPEVARIERPTIETTAIVGMDRPGRDLAPGEALLVKAVDGKYFLVFDGRRAAVDVTNDAVQLAFGIAAVSETVMRDERRISTGLLNAIPEAPALVSPITELGEPSAVPELDGRPVGTVIEVARVETFEYYVIVQGGVQQVPKSLADLIRFTVSEDEDFFKVSPEDIVKVPKSSELDTSGFPAELPKVLSVADSRLACLNWTIVEGQQRTSITVANQLTMASEKQRPVKLAQHDGSGDRLDYVFVPTGRGAAVRGVVPGQPDGTGTIFLVTDNGAKFGVPSWNGRSATELAGAIGLTTIRPAPEAILRLLPSGPALDPDQAVRTFDSVPVVDGAGATLPQPDQQAVPLAPVEPPVEGEEVVDPFNPLPGGGAGEGEGDGSGG
ncbi:MAG TPA: type VII secretion protein EccB [Pseudonocardiaceae bacterium]